MSEPSCPACDSFDATFLGTLGRLDHLRCRDCGMDYSVSNEEDEVEDEPDCDDGDDGYALASAGFGTDEDYGGGGCDMY